MKKIALWVVVVVLSASGAAGAQQSAEEAERKKAADQAAADKAGWETMAKMAAEQAEAVERARLKVAQEAQQEIDKRDQERIARATAVIPIEVEIVISRFQGEKKVSSLPYSVSVNAQEAAIRPTTRLRMGGRVPVPVMSPALGPDGKPIVGITGGGPVHYEDIGTTVESNARPLWDGRYDIYIAISDSAVAPTPPAAVSGAPPVIRTFVSNNNVVLRDGQTRQFTAATDRITGEVVKVDVTLRVLK